MTDMMIGFVAIFMSIICMAICSTVALLCWYAVALLRDWLMLGYRRTVDEWQDRSRS